jgi:hypothetical protein
MISGNVSPLVRISIFLAIIVLLVVIEFESMWLVDFALGYADGTSPSPTTACGCSNATATGTPAEARDHLLTLATAVVR